MISGHHALRSHNAKALMRWLLGRGVGAPELRLDTAIAAYLIDPADNRYALSDLLPRYTGRELPKDSAASAGQLDFGDGPDERQVAAREALAVSLLSTALESSLENLGPLCYEAVEVELTLYHPNGEQESRLLFVGPTSRAIHEAQRRCMVEDVSALLARQFDKERVAEVTALVERLFDEDWKNRGAQEAKPERAFETYARPARKHLH